MVQGLAELERRWGAIPARVKMALRYELEEIADQIVQQMYSVAPQRTGDLAQSIQWTWGDAPEGAMTIGTVRGSGKQYGTLRITIFAAEGDTFYGRFQEFGTKNMPPNPFFLPVWRARRRGVKSRVTRAISQAIRQS